jgi:hypothetical protein
LEPIDDCTIDQRWELPGAIPHLITNRTEAEGHVEVLANPADEERPQILRSVSYTSPLATTADSIANRVFLVVGIQISNFTGS